MTDENTNAPRGRGEAAVDYSVQAFGTHMAPYAFSIDTCIKIFYYFYEGYAHGGLPLGITQKDIESDRYLLDILYHVCCHKEIAESSNLAYPMDDSNVPLSFAAKQRTLEQLKKILSEEDEYGNNRYTLWCEDGARYPKEDSDLWRLMNESNLPDERFMLQAAMRAIVLFYWTKGLTTSKIREITKFQTFSKIITGDIERIAEATSFHLDAIHKCLGSASFKEKSVCENNEALKEFYALHTRVKYGMPHDLVIFANKHIHGLDRGRLLELKTVAAMNGVTPLQYLYVTPPNKIPKNILTLTQLAQLKQAMERRGTVGSIDTLMEILQNDLTAELTSEKLENLRAIASWGGTDDGKIPDTRQIYDSIKNIVRESDALSSIKISTDGEAYKIIWDCESNFKLHIGVLCSNLINPEIANFLEEDEDKVYAKILIAPRTFTDGELKGLKDDYPNATAILDNVYLTFALANGIRMPLDKGLALTEMLGDLRGIFTQADYNHLPLLRYLRTSNDSSPKLRLIYGSSLSKRFENLLTEGGLESALQESEDMREFEILPWGCVLNSDIYDFTVCPTIILLSRNDIIHSESLNRFIYRMRQQQFKNCILLLESEYAENVWSSTEETEDYGSNRWSEQYNIIQKAIVHNTMEAVRRIRDFVSAWKWPGYLVGISYGHYDPESTSRPDSADVGLIKQLAQKLSNEYGEDRILFDEFEPAKRLFSDNRGKEKSLAEYRKCRYYVVLWNSWTANSENCKAEREIIFDRCKDDTNKCMFLQANHPGNPDLPNGYFSQTLSKPNLDTIFENIKQIISELLG